MTARGHFDGCRRLVKVSGAGYVHRPMSDPIAPLIENLHAEGRLRVWSLVITVFGDLVQHRGGAISSARLGRLLRRVGVEQGTMRTAMSRLGQDGWVTSERRGRSSLYRLSADGVARFAPATARIYAAPRLSAVSEWSLSVSLAGGVRLEPSSEATGHPDLQVTGRIATLTPEYRSGLLGDGHRAALAALGADLAALASARPKVPVDAAAARMLLVHRWRRIVLRYPDVAAELMPDDTPLADPRGAVASAYAGIAPLAERWLDSDEEYLEAMPAADGRFPDRFGGLQQA